MFSVLAINLSSLKVHLILPPKVKLYKVSFFPPPINCIFRIKHVPSQKKTAYIWLTLFMYLTQRQNLHKRTQGLPWWCSG